MKEPLLPSVDLYEEIYGLIRQIPVGKVSTPRDLSEALGDIKAVRAVTEIIKTSELSNTLPLHRVVSKEGSPLCLSLAREVRLELLRKEGVEVVRGGVLSLEKYLFNNFETSFPLKRLQELQERLAREVVLEDRYSRALEVIAGVDVSYREKRGFGVCVVMDRSFRVLDEVEVEMEVGFPYISSYLAFREGPIIMKTLEKVDKSFDALMINGYGIAHPRGCGIATHMGLLLGDKPTIGIATTKLLNRVKQGEASWTPSEYGDRIIEAEIRRGGHGKIYVSPGNNITLEKSLEVVEAFLGEHRLPEPLWCAHNRCKIKRFKGNR